MQLRTHIVHNKCETDGRTERVTNGKDALFWVFRDHVIKIEDASSNIATRVIAIS